MGQDVFGWFGRNKNCLVLMFSGFYYKIWPCAYICRAILSKRKLLYSSFNFFLHLIRMSFESNLCCFYISCPQSFNYHCTQEKFGISKGISTKFTH